MMTELKTQDTAPDFSLPCEPGHEFRLADHKGHCVVLYFYPKDDTPGCTTQACDVRDLFDQFKDCCVVGISKDTLKSHADFRLKHQLPFPLLSDIDGKICQLYGVWKQKMNFGKTYNGIERSTFLISPDQTILKIWRNVRVQNHMERVLSEVKKMMDH